MEEDYVQEVPCRHAAELAEEGLEQLAVLIALQGESDIVERLQLLPSVLEKAFGWWMNYFILLT